MILAGLIAAAEAALSSFSKARANELVGGARRAPSACGSCRRPTALPQYRALLRLIEISAIILVANVSLPDVSKTWRPRARPPAS